MFDLDGTLRYNKPSSQTFFLDSAVQLGAQDSPENRLQATRWALHFWAQPENLDKYLRLLFEKDEEFNTFYSKQLLLAFGCDQEMAEAIVDDVIQIVKNEFKPVDSVKDDVFKTLDYLKAQEFRLAIVTNRHESCSEQLDSLGLTSYFEFTVIAGEINQWKPEAGIFTHALERMDINSTEALYVGDNYYTDIIGAQRAGLSPVLIDPKGIFPEAECKVISTMSDLLTLDYTTSQ